MAGMSLRAVKSPLAPKMTMEHGSVNLRSIPMLKPWSTDGSTSIGTQWRKPRKNSTRIRELSVTVMAGQVFWPASVCFWPASHNFPVAIGQKEGRRSGKRGAGKPLLTQINFSKSKSRVDLGKATVDLGLGLAWFVVMEGGEKRRTKNKQSFFLLKMAWKGLEHLDAVWKDLVTALESPGIRPGEAGEISRTALESLGSDKGSKRMKGHLKWILFQRPCRARG